MFDLARKRNDALSWARAWKAKAKELRADIAERDIEISNLWYRVELRDKEIAELERRLDKVTKGCDCCCEVCHEIMYVPWCGEWICPRCKGIRIKRVKA